MIIAAFVVSVLALIASFGAVWYARAQVAQAREQTEAANAQAEYARRAYELEKERFEQEKVEQATQKLARQRAAMAPTPTPWNVFRVGKNAVSLSNSAPRKLYDVALSFDVEPARVEPRDWAVVDEHASVRVMVLRAMGASPNEITVSWRDSPDGEVRKWTTALL
ncbi:hypothetical protein [Cellulomonas sp. PS-H5]|uniref:hypothetical protein n=1 Tax=Cellulomonas sp. PS-H5 TaxID=2820400 RepID=UPI001C4FADCD|nr:hypothetical protein [Cellulomonas sp. PS-H5]MBW0254969.1 hypothetical protein [Cellulomonas sp. PS-H5]